MSHEKIAGTFDTWVADGKDAGLEEGHKDVVEQVIGQLNIAPGEKVLDLGCGNGWATRHIAKINAGVQAIGVDVSPQMIAKADELHSFTIRARYDLGKFEALDFKDGEFDRVFSMEALYYATDLDASIGELARVLKPGGKADIVINLFAESPGTECWAENLGLSMHRLSEAEWVARFEAAGFAGVTTSRVIDRRGPGDESAFTPDRWWPDWATKVAHHEAGSLWIHAEKPA